MKGLQMAEIVLDSVKGYVARSMESLTKALEGLTARLDAVESREPVTASDVVEELLATDKVKTLVDLHVAEAVKAYFDANPVVHGKDGDAGERGEKGEPGTGLAGAMIDRDGALVVTLSDGKVIPLGAVVGKNGDPGADGFGFDDLTAEFDGERTLSLKFVKGDREKRFNFDLPVMIHRGFYRDGMSFKSAETVTHDGNLWYAKRDTTSAPGHEHKDDWQLAARRGRDGRDGKAPPSKDPVSLKGNEDA